MNQNQITLIVIGFILVALMATNPSIEDHRQAVVDNMDLSESSGGDNQWEKVGQAIGIALGQGIVEKAVTRENYILFSITTISFGGIIREIGIGVFGKVWITNNLDKEEYSNESNLDNIDTNSENFVDTAAVNIAENTIVNETDVSSLSSNADNENFILSCYPPNGTNLILNSPNLKDIHPAWIENIKSGFSLSDDYIFNAVKKIQNEQGVFIYGNIYSHKMFLFNDSQNGFDGMVWVPLREWDCSDYEDYQKLYQRRISQRKNNEPSVN
jgi:hypothetical protein